MLKVKKLHEDAIIPTCANPGEDLGYDLYALEDAKLYPGCVTKNQDGHRRRVLCHDASAKQDCTRIHGPSSHPLRPSDS
jgi:hypothetical protein